MLLLFQYKDAFMKANPDYKWHNPERMTQLPTTKLNRPTNERVPSVSTFLSEDGPIVPGKLAGIYLFKQLKLMS